MTTTEIIALLSYFDRCDPNTPVVWSVPGPPGPFYGEVETIKENTFEDGKSVVVITFKRNWPRRPVPAPTVREVITMLDAYPLHTPITIRVPVFEDGGQWILWISDEILTVQDQIADETDRRVFICLSASREAVT